MFKGGKMGWCEILNGFDKHRIERGHVALAIMNREQGVRECAGTMS